MAAINYKNFTLNSPGDDAPWSTQEQQTFKDIVDTMVKDCYSPLMDTSNGHVHYRLYDTSGGVGIRCTTNGVQRFESTSAQYMQFTTTSSGDTTVKTTGGDIYFTDASDNSAFTIENDRDYVFTLGDAAGARKLTIDDSAGVDQFTVDSDGNLYAKGDIYSVVRSDYSNTSTIVGFTAGYSKQIFYKLVGKQLTCWYDISGTSNNSTTSFTLPNNNNSSHTVWMPCYTQDNTSTFAAGYAYMGQGTNIVTVYPNMTSTSWTTSGGKRVAGTLIIDI